MKVPWKRPPLCGSTYGVVWRGATPRGAIELGQNGSRDHDNCRYHDVEMLARQGLPSKSMPSVRALGVPCPRRSHGPVNNGKDFHISLSLSCDDSLFCCGPLPSRDEESVWRYFRRHVPIALGGTEEKAVLRSRFFPVRELPTQRGFPKFRRIGPVDVGHHFRDSL